MQDKFQGIKSFREITETDILQRINQTEACRLKRHVDKSDVLVVYLTGLSLTIDGNIYLLSNNFGFETNDSNSMDDKTELCVVLKHILNLPVKKKVVLLDVCRMPPDPRLGVLVDEFPTLLDDTIKNIDDPNLWVITASGEHQISRVSHADRRSVFSMAVQRALGPIRKSDATESSDGLPRITIKEFFESVDETCRALSKSADGLCLQTPLLLLGGQGIVDIKVNKDQADQASAFQFARRKIIPDTTKGPKNREEGQTEGKGKTSTIQQPRTSQLTTWASRHSSPVANSAIIPSWSTVLLALVSQEGTDDGTSPSQEKSPNSTTDTEETSAVENTPPGKTDKEQPTLEKDTAATPPEPKTSPATVTEERNARYSELIRIWGMVDYLQNLRDNQSDEHLGYSAVPGHLWGVTPADISAELWRKLIWDLTFCEHRILISGTRSTGELREIKFKLEALESALSENRWTAEKRSIYSDWYDAWQAFNTKIKRDNIPERLLKHPDYSRELRQKRELVDILLRTYPYVQWHDRESLRSPKGVNEYQNIIFLLEKLKNSCDRIRKFQENNPASNTQPYWWLGTEFQDVIKAEKQLDTILTKRLNQTIENLELLTENMIEADRLLDLLQLPIYSAEDRERAYAALAAYRDKDLGKKFIADDSITDDPRPTNTWDRAKDRAHIYALFINLIDPNPIDEPKQDYIEYRKFGQDIKKHFDQLNMIRISQTDSKLDNATILAAYLLDPRDVDRQGPVRHVPLPGPRIDSHQFKTKIVFKSRNTENKPEFIPLPEVRIPMPWVIQFSVIGRIEKLDVRFDFNDTVLTINRWEGNQLEPVQTGVGFPVDVDQSSGNIEIPIEITGLERRGELNDETRTEKMHLVLTADDGLSERRDYDIRLPGPTGIRLFAEQRGHDGTWHPCSSNTDLADVLVLEPFPNRQSSFRFSAKNLSDKTKSFELDVFSLRPPGQEDGYPPGKLTFEDSIHDNLVKYAANGAWKKNEPIATSGPIELPAATKDGSSTTLIKLASTNKTPSADDRSPNNETGDKLPTTQPDSVLQAITNGLLFVIYELDAEGKRLAHPSQYKWAEVNIRHPENFLQLAANLDDRYETLQLMVDRNPECSFLPDDVNRENPIAIEWNQEATCRWITPSRNDSINSFIDKAVVIGKISQNAEWPLLVSLNVDQWRCALVYRIEKNNSILPETNIKKPVRIVAIDYPKQDENHASENRKNHPHYKFPVCDQLNIKIQVDAPTNAFVSGSGKDRIALYIDNSEDPLVTAYDSRDHRVTITDLETGVMVVHTQSSDHVFSIPAKDFPGHHTLKLKYHWTGFDEIGDTADFLIDNERPDFRSFQSEKQEYMEDEPITLILEAYDNYEIRGIEFGWESELERNGELDDKEPDDKVGKKPLDGDRWQLTSRKPLIPGTYYPVVRIVDMVGNERHVCTPYPDTKEPLVIQVLAKESLASNDSPDSGSTKKSTTQEKLFVHVELVYGTGKIMDSSDASKWTVKLVGGGAPSPSLDGRLFVFSKVPPGKYTVEATGRIGGSRASGQAADVVPKPEQESQRNIVQVEVREGDLKKE
ncbi:MAG: hypothetical protein JW829_04490 [Pirellulales bacterium]|nr:hypothetical protein [Pirellulales bacterium]